MYCISIVGGVIEKSYKLLSLTSHVQFILFQKSCRYIQSIIIMAQLDEMYVDSLDQDALYLNKCVSRID